MKKESAGLLMFRARDNVLQVLLVHPGGPIWQSRDAGIWSIPKGEIEGSDDAFTTAIREFEEETGIKPQGPYEPLGTITQRSGKKVHAWAFRGDCDTSQIRSNLIQIEWPPESTIKITIPEIHRGEFFDIPAALQKIIPTQAPLLLALQQLHP